MTFLQSWSQSIFFFWFTGGCIDTFSIRQRPFGLPFVLAVNISPTWEGSNFYVYLRYYPFSMKFMITPFPFPFHVGVKIFQSAFFQIMPCFTLRSRIWQFLFFSGPTRWQETESCGVFFLFIPHIQPGSPQLTKGDGSGRASWWRHMIEQDRARKNQLSFTVGSVGRVKLKGSV